MTPAHGKLVIRENPGVRRLSGDGITALGIVLEGPGNALDQNHCTGANMEKEGRRVILRSSVFNINLRKH